MHAATCHTRRCDGTNCRRPSSFCDCNEGPVCAKHGEPMPCSICSEIATLTARNARLESALRALRSCGCVNDGCECCRVFLRILNSADLSESLPPSSEKADPKYRPCRVCGKSEPRGMFFDGKPIVACLPCWIRSGDCVELKPATLGEEKK